MPDPASRREGLEVGPQRADEELHHGADAGQLTRTRARRDAAARFRQSGFATPELDARLLAEGAFSREEGAVARELEVFADYVARRLDGEPVWRILGEREFWGLPFRLSAATLEPRPDSETLIDAVIAALAERRGEALRILDLGTGTGCLLVAALHELPAATGIGVDVDPLACETAAGNVALNRLSARAAILRSDWDAAVDGRFDLVLSNPPYIETAVIPTLDRGVRDFDPPLALDGGTDGFDAYRALAGILPRRLAPAGIAVIEIGAGQGASVTALMREAGLELLASRHDLSGHERALVFGASAKPVDDFANSL